MVKVKQVREEVREKSDEEILTQISEVEQELMSLRFRHASGQLEQTARLRELRRSIARLKTIYREKQEGSELEAEAA